MVTRLSLVARRQLLPCPDARHLLLPLLDLRGVALAVGGSEESVKSARRSTENALGKSPVRRARQDRGLTLRSMPSSRILPKPVMKGRGRRGLRGKEGDELSATVASLHHIHSCDTPHHCLSDHSDTAASQASRQNDEGNALSKRGRFWIPRAYIRVMNPTAPKPATHEKTAARVWVSV